MDVKCQLSGLDLDAWRAGLDEVAEEHGYFEPLGPSHHAAFLDGDRTLLVTFETVDSVRRLNPGAEPRGFDFARRLGWSTLAILSEGETWFRDKRVFGYFDRLIDDGFFEDFDQVLFYGADSGGYAAAAFSVAAPGATVLSMRPQATLSPEHAGWDSRHRAQRRLNFTDRYGYAPRMADAARAVFVLADPTQPFDAMHAALFANPHVVQLRCPRLGRNLLQGLEQMGLVAPLIEKAMDQSLGRHSFAKLWRSRRHHYGYLRALLGTADRAGREAFAARICRFAAQEFNRAPFDERLRSYRAQGYFPEAAQ